MNMRIITTDMIKEFETQLQNDEKKRGKNDFKKSSGRWRIRFRHRPFVFKGCIYLLLAVLLFLPTPVSVMTAPPLMKIRAIHSCIWLLSPVSGLLGVSSPEAFSVH